MTARTLRLLALGLSLVLTQAASAQGPTPKPAPDPVVKEKMDLLKGAFKNRKGELDEQAIQVIDGLLPTHDDMHEKDQSLFVKTLGGAFKAKRKPEDMAIYVAAAAALGKIGGKGPAKALNKAYENKKFGKRKVWASLQDTLLEQVGLCREPKQIKFLLDEASRSPHDGVKAAAGRALRHYEEHPFKERVAIVKQMVQAFANVANQAAEIGRQDQTVEAARRTLRAISDPWNETLGVLTGENLRTAPEWRSWWNDHKNKPKRWKHQTES